MVRPLALLFTATLAYCWGWCSSILSSPRNRWRPRQSWRPRRGYPGRRRRKSRPRAKLADIPFDADQSFKYLNQLCDLGPRPGGSEKMIEQQKLLEGHFKKLGAQVVRQEFRTRHPLTGENVTMINIIVQWHPDKKSGSCSARTTTRVPIPIATAVTARGSSWGPTTAAAAPPC